MNKLLMILSLAIFMAVASKPVFAAEIINSEVCNQAPSSPVCQTGNTTKNPAVDSINRISTVLAVLTGVAAVIMIIVGGLTMITSSGNAENVAKARRRIIYSLVGLIVVALAWTIIHFVTDKLIQ